MNNSVKKKEAKGLDKKRMEIREAVLGEMGHGSVGKRQDDCVRGMPKAEFNEYMKLLKRRGFWEK